MNDETKNEPGHGTGSAAKNDGGAPPSDDMRSFWGCFWGPAVVALLLCLTYFMGAEYQDQHAALKSGTRGTFTLSKCVHEGGASSGGETNCYGTFRSEPGGTVRRDVTLFEKNDARGLKRGDSFPARLADGEVHRDDEVGEENRFENAVGWAGFGVIAFAFAGLGTVLLLWRRPGRARTAVRTVLVLILLVGVAMWVGGMTAGGGLSV